MVFLALTFFFLYVPHYVDQSKNSVYDNTSVKYSQSYQNIPFIADLHCDALLWDRDLSQEHNYGHLDLPRMVKANMALQIFTIVSKSPKGQNIEYNTDETDNITLLGIAQLRPLKTWFNLKERALSQCEDLYNLAESSEGQFRVITSQEDLKTFIQDRKTNSNLMAGMLGLEGAHCLFDDIHALDDFYKAGVRYIGIAHFFDNAWGGSAHGVKRGGLTDLGKLLVKKMNELHITIDLAHASLKTIDDVLEYSQNPVIVSHTGVQGICKNTRNLSDRHLMEIGKRGGLIGIGLWETAVCGTDAESTAKSIRYVADKIGVEHVALGSDFDGAVKAHFDVTHLPLVYNALKKQGFSEQDIRKIMGENIRNFFLKNLPERD